MVITQSARQLPLRPVPTTTAQRSESNLLTELGLSGGSSQWMGLLPAPSQPRVFCSFLIHSDHARLRCWVQFGGAAGICRECFEGFGTIPNGSRDQPLGVISFLRPSHDTSQLLSASSLAFPRSNVLQIISLRLHF